VIVHERWRFLLYRQYSVWGRLSMARHFRTPGTAGVSVFNAERLTLIHVYSIPDPIALSWAGVILSRRHGDRWRGGDR